MTAKRCLWIAALIALSPTAALGEESFGSLGLRASNLSMGEGEASQVGFGAALRLRLSEGWGLEGAAEVWSPSEDGARSSIPLSVSALRYFLPGLPLNPYLLAGAGFNMAAGLGEIDSSRYFGSAGVGLSLEVRSFVISGDLRYLFLERSGDDTNFLNSSARCGQGSVSLGYAF